MAGAEVIGKEEIREVLEVLETGVLARYGFDRERRGIWKVRDFERAFAAYCGARFALGVSSGSTALKVALTALDVGPGDEVIVPAFTFLATYEAVLEVGAIPVMADIDDTLNLDPEEIGRKRTVFTKAVIPVHMCGSAARIDRIVERAGREGLLVLEDNAQGCGAGFQGKKLGTFGHMGIFSFDHYKTVTTGEGGMVLTNDESLYLRAEWCHDHGHDHRGPTRATDGRTMLGFNYRMNELQGAVGLAQLRKLDDIIAAQQRNKRFLKESLAAVPGVGFRHIPDPDGDSATFLAFHLPTEEAARRYQEALAAGGVDAVCFKRNLWHYVPNWEHFLARATAQSKRYPFADPANRGGASYDRNDIPRAEDLLGRTLVLGISVRMPEERLEAMANAFHGAAKVL